jgi:hypothetical protein
MERVSVRVLTVCASAGHNLGAPVTVWACLVADAQRNVLPVMAFHKRDKVCSSFTFKHLCEVLVDAVE